MNIVNLLSDNAKIITLDLDSRGCLTNGEILLGVHPSKDDIAVINNAWNITSNQVSQHDITVDLTSDSSILICRCRLDNGQVVIKVRFSNTETEYYAIVDNKLTQISIAGYDIVDEIQVQIHQLNDSSIFNEPIILRWVDFLWAMNSWSATNYGLEFIIVNTTTIRVVPYSSGDSISPLSKPISINLTDKTLDSQVAITLSTIKEEIDKLIGITRNDFVSR